MKYIKNCLIEALLFKSTRGFITLGIIILLFTLITWLTGFDFIVVLFWILIIIGLFRFGIAIRNQIRAWRGQ